MIRNLLLIVVVLVPMNVKSQVFEGGFFGGFTASQVDGDNYSGFDKFGITAGGYIIKKHLRRTNWKMEIRYIQKGSAKRPTEFDQTYYKLAIHYVEIPILYQYEVNKKLILEAGLTPDVYLFHKEQDENGEITHEDGPVYHRFGLNVEIGVLYRVSDKISVGTRLSNSVIPMRNHASNQTYLLNRGQYNKLFHFTAYYQFE